jgi:hypothetical protein
MGSFVTDERIPIVEFDPSEVISNTPPRTIWIRAKMNVGVRNRVTGKMVKFGPNGKEVELDLGENLNALLEENILAWEGGDFDGVPCTKENIRKLDPTDPFIDRVADEIAKRNKPKESPDPKEVTPASSMSAGGRSLMAAVRNRQETGTPT